MLWGMTGDGNDTARWVVPENEHDRVELLELLWRLREEEPAPAARVATVRRDRGWPCASAQGAVSVGREGR